MEVAYAPRFVRLLNALPVALQEEAIEKIALFQNEKNHLLLKVHKLKGGLKEQYSFSVNYRTRIIFTYLSTKPREAVLLTIGDHDVYDQ